MQKLGLVLVIVSFLPWVTIFLIVPLLPLAITQKALMVTVLAIVAEVLFWLGLLVVGKEAAQKYRRYLSLGYFKNQLKKFWGKR